MKWLVKAYSTLLTGEQQRAWNVAAAKVLSRPRLGQCGRLTGQQHFVAINSSRARIEREMLFWPPSPVAFGPNPVDALTFRYIDGRLRIELNLSGPVAEDIMVFAQTPCSPGWKKWRHGTCLGLLPVRGYPGATLRPCGGQPVGTPKPPRSHPEATQRLPRGYPEATRRLPGGYPEQRKARR